MAPLITQAPMREALRHRLHTVRAQTEALVAPLQVEDTVTQPIPETSPLKWHLGHTTWFFEHFLLKPHAPSYREWHPLAVRFFNSYYESIGGITRKDVRGVLSRPTLAQVLHYRNHVTGALHQFLETAPEPLLAELDYTLQMGIGHEEQHQELMVQDIKQVLWWNIERPGYGPAVEKWAGAEAQREAPPLQFLTMEMDGFGCGTENHEGDKVYEREELLWSVGAETGFYFDNEGPEHEVFLPDFKFANRPVTCCEYLEFIEAGGYREPRFWLSDGWNHAQEHRWAAPLYWEQRDSEWWLYTLAGMRKLNPAEPLCHVSFYEAEAYATFRGKRLPTEQEWEASSPPPSAPLNILEHGWLHPRVADQSLEPYSFLQAYSDVWEWTSSPYVPYPGYVAPRTGMGEYNGKFMSNQMVLRGGSFATPQAHLRRTYRNFYRPHERWQPAGIRLAQ